VAELERGGIDGVIFYIPPGDLAFGWDYPRLAELVRARGLQSLLLLGQDVLRAEGKAHSALKVRGFVDTLVQSAPVEAIS
jgi:hypothetical protein